MEQESSHGHQRISFPALSAERHEPTEDGPQAVRQAHVSERRAVLGFGQGIHGNQTVNGTNNENGPCNPCEGAADEVVEFDHCVSLR